MPPHSYYQAYIDAVAQRDQLVLTCALIAYSVLFIAYGLSRLVPQLGRWSIGIVIGGFYASMGALAVYLYVLT